MRKNLLPLLLSLAFLSQTAVADNLRLNLNSPGNNGGSGGESLKKLVEYLKNLGTYLGYDLTKEPEADSTKLLNLEQREGELTNLVDSLFGAMPVSSNGSDNPAPFFPANGKLKISPAINELANSTFSVPTKYNSPEPAKISVNENIDQKDYQGDPVSQSIFNILTTPDSSFCMYDGAWITAKGQAGGSDCDYLYQGQVVKNVIGDYPVNFVSKEYNQPLVSQLNSNTLLSPLLYSQEKQGAEAKNKGDNPGLEADNQAVQAANFVRYAIADVLPLPLANKEKYLELMRTAAKVDPDTTFAAQKNAQSILGNYLTGLRVYAAQRSVAISNLYSMLSRRIAQTSKSKDTTPTSEALSEFTMAAWRLKEVSDESGQTPNQQWLKQINEASSATVQKEIAVLLAEINYQMYLSRQQQERLLLTNTMILMQNMKDKEPSLIKNTVEAASLAPPTKGK